ncbi:MAG: helix-turn-helix domain-containing protein [Clostridiales bacterium]|nr:helix-turn-helix domain-containing protein [Clostridiales bacterium]
MVKHALKEVLYAPLYIHSFQLLLPHRMDEAAKFNGLDPDRLVSTADKLRYYRYKKALLQREVADYAGIDRSTYIKYEAGLDYYPPDKLGKIAELLGVDIADLLDKYNAFIRNGQGPQIRALRRQMRLTQKEFGKRFGIHETTVREWEHENIRISKKQYIKLFM